MKTLKFNYLAAVLILVFGGMFIACNNLLTPKQDLGEFVEMETLLKDTTYQGKRVSVEGYFCLTSDLETRSDKFGLSFLSDVKFNKEAIPVYNWKTPSVTVYLKCYKDGVNTFYVPSSFEEKDLKLYTNDGEELPYNAKVRLSGDVDFNTGTDFRVYRDLGRYIVYLHNVRIDKLEE